MSLFPLFESGEVVLLDDGRGRVTYTPDFVDDPTASDWFAELRNSVPWRRERRMMYDREVDVPRLTAHFRLDSPQHVPILLLDAAQRTSHHLHVPFNSVGLNFYRDGKDSVAPHSDHVNDLRKGCPIALLSLGARRRMIIRATATPHHTIRVELASGSLLVMDYATQLHYTHGVPKTNDPAGERISLAFRVRKA